MREANWIDILTLKIGLCELYRVEGDSMLPILKDGDQVLIKPASELKIGDIVLAHHPYKTSVKIIKRIFEIAGEKYSLTGDNPAESTDSRTFGLISRKDILGKVDKKLK